MEVKLFDFLNSINSGNDDIMTEENEKIYNAYVINHFLSGTIDTVLLANEMNTRPHLDVRMQYDFLRNIVRKKKRFTKWLKPEKFDKIETIKEYYGYNNNKAKDIADLVSDEELEHMLMRLEKGGVQNRKSKKAK